MKLAVILFATAVILATTAYGNDLNTRSRTTPWPAPIQVLAVDKTNHLDVLGSLANGKPISDFDIPGHCSDELIKRDVTGNHVLYGLTVAPDTNVTIKLALRQNKKPVTLYAYSLPSDKFELPNRAASSRDSSQATCRTAVAPSTIGAGSTLSDELHTIRFPATPEEKNIVVGVAGGDHLRNADFTLFIVEAP